MKIALIVAEQECDKCRQAKAILERITQRFPQIEYVALRSDDPEAAAYGVVMSPTVVVDDTIVASGRAPNEGKLTAFIEQTIGE